ncbi:MAG: AAA family ATPase [Eggerthellaceae bacterium]
MRDQEERLLGICKRHVNMQDVARMDPFTFMALFNHKFSDANRIAIVADILSDFSIDEEPPQDFTGIPLVNSQQWRFMDDVDFHIDEKWDFFEEVVRYARNEGNDAEFIELFDKVLAQKNIGPAKLTMALFWCFPYTFLPLDSNTKTFIYDAYFFTYDSKHFNGSEYLNLLKNIREQVDLPFTEISANAYVYDGWGPLSNVFDPGINATLWSELLQDREVFTDPSLDMLSKMLQLGGQATCKELENAFGRNVGYYKGVGTALGERIAKKLNIESRINQWGGNQYWSIPFLGKDADKKQPGIFIWKIRPELKEALEAKPEIFKGLDPTPKVETPLAETTDTAAENTASASTAFEPYTDEDFLAEVYMQAEDFHALKRLAKEKKNVILQGAPGTGKTFAAERLAWAIMGCKDKSRVQKVQFHQNTSYDEFVIGFRPNEQGGFHIQEGPFHSFCQQAAADPEREYFFIIDEINRANISKVFGELLMLIEESHRGESLRLGIDGRMFSVPANVIIIGMMNTADRGLALIDYALRRRFAFFEMKPALSNEAFAQRVANCEDTRMPDLVDAVSKLNKRIAEDPALGDGFCIGHSYFCKSKEQEPDCVASVIEYELVPLVKEYWFDDRKTADEEISKLKDVL